MFNDKTISEVFYCKRDELSIYGKMYTPKDSGQGPLPAVIVSHGFMSTHKIVANYAKTIAEMGYVTFAFDFNGGGIGSKSQGKTTDMTVFTEVADLEAVLAYVKTLDIVDKDQITLMGCSQGGFVSAMAAPKHAEDVHKLILVYPALCIPDDARKGSMMFSKFDPDNIPDVFRCGPMKLGKNYPACVMDKDPYDLIKGYDKPVLILHGDKDTVVDLSYSVEADKRYQNSRLEVMAGGAHMFSKKVDKLAYEYIEAFLKA